MATMNNTIDKFGRRRRGTSKSIILRGPPGLGFELTSDGDFDIQNKRLKKMGEPVDSQDGATRNYVDRRLTNYHAEVRKSFGEANDLIIKNLKSYVNVQIIKSKEESTGALNQRNIDLMEQMRSYIDKKVSEVSTDLIEQMRAYIGKQLVGVTGSNIMLMQQHNKLEARIAKLEQIDVRRHTEQKSPDVPPLDPEIADILKKLREAHKASRDRLPLLDPSIIDLLEKKLLLLLPNEKTPDVPSPDKKSPDVSTLDPEIADILEKLRKAHKASRDGPPVLDPHIIDLLQKKLLASIKT